MKKFILLAIVLSVIVLNAIYYYLSPYISLKNMREALLNNNINDFSKYVDAGTLASNYDTAMQFYLSKTAKYNANSTDYLKLEQHYSLYFLQHSISISRPVFISKIILPFFMQSNFEENIKFINPLVIKVSIKSKFGDITFGMSRILSGWRISSMYFYDYMPRFWDMPTSLYGIYRIGTFNDCCMSGNERIENFHLLKLFYPIDILTTYIDDPTEETMFNVMYIELAYNKSTFSNITNGDIVEVKCKSLEFGNTGGYALPTYCADPKIRKMAQ